MNWNKDKHRSFISPTKSNHRSLAGNIHLPDRVLITSGSAVLHHRDNFIVIFQWSNAFTYQLLLFLLSSPGNVTLRISNLQTTSCSVKAEEIGQGFLSVSPFCTRPHPPKFFPTVCHKVVQNSGKWTGMLHVPRVMFYAASSVVANVSLIDKSTALFCLRNLKCFHVCFVLPMYYG